MLTILALAAIAIAYAAGRWIALDPGTEVAQTAIDVLDALDEFDHALQNPVDEHTQCARAVHVAQHITGELHPTTTTGATS